MCEESSKIDAFSDPLSLTNDTYLLKICKLINRLRFGTLYSSGVNSLTFLSSFFVLKCLSSFSVPTVCININLII